MSPMRDGRTTEQGKIGLLSQWKLEAEFRNLYYDKPIQLVALTCKTWITGMEPRPMKSVFKSNILGN